MSTVEIAPGETPGLSWVDDALNRGERTKVDIDWRRVFLAALLAVPLAMGWTAGTVVRLAVFAWAAAGEGYLRGRVQRPASGEGLRR